MRLFSASPSSSPHRQGAASSPLLSITSTPLPRASPRSPSSGGGSTRSFLRSPPLAGAASGAARDELLALARQSRHLEHRLQAQLDAQSAGLLAGLGLADDGTSSQGSRPASSAGYAASPSPARPRTSRHLDVADDKPPPLPTTRRAIHGTLQELAELKSYEAAALAETLAPLDTFLANARALEKKKQGLEAAIAKQDSQDARDALQSLGDEATSLQKDIQELEDTLATKRARLRHVQAKREHDASTLDARLSSWRAAAADVEARIKSEVLAGRGLPGRSNERGRTRTDAEEDVWALPASRRTVDLVREAVTKDRRVVEQQRAAASSEAAAATAGADVWQSAVGAVRGVERVLRREMRRLTSNPAPAASTSVIAGATKSENVSNSHPLATSTRHTSPPHSPQPVIPLDPLRPASPVGEPDSVTASFATARSHAMSSGSASTVLPPSSQTHFAGPTTTYDATTVAPRTNVAVAHDVSVSDGPTRTVLAHMDAAIAALAKDVALAADRGWNVLVVAIGAELAALREGRNVLTGHHDDDDNNGGEAIEMDSFVREEPRSPHGSDVANKNMTGMPARVAHQHASPGTILDADTTPTPKPAQLAFQTPYRDEDDSDRTSPLIPLERGDTEDDAPSLDLLVEAAGEV